MKHLRLFSCLLALVLALSACGGPAEPETPDQPDTPPEQGQFVPPQEDAPAAPDDLDAQLAAIADELRVQRGLCDETFLWSGGACCAVTDLDQNGRLELLFTEIQGTGHFTTSLLWEVNEALDGTALCPEDENVPLKVPAFYDTEEVIYPVYLDEDTGTYFYLFKDTFRPEFSCYTETLQAVSLRDGALSGEFITFTDTLYDPETADETVTYFDGARAPISEEAYTTAAADRFADCTPMAADIGWLVQADLDAMEDSALMDALRQSWESFALSPA